MPEGLWREAAELGLAHGFGRVAKTLGLDYNSLKKRAASVARAHDGAPDFVEILRGGLPMRQPECTIEMDDGTGAKLRIHLAGPAVPDLAELSRSFWEGQR
ncbi:MAG: hypothetical protein HZA54_19760 [Planctomycetes bacterium]|nr:hypothetical protein [Planctomycetota bacterium]